MKAFASPEISGDSESRPRPFGVGRLFGWRLLQDATLPLREAGPIKKADQHLVVGGLDPEVLSKGPSAFTVSFAPVAEFVVDFQQQTVALTAFHPRTDQNTIDHLLDDQIAPRIIAAEGHLVLHASACVIGGRIAVFLGQTGSGKSTLAASLHAEGNRLLGDDAVVITDVDGVFVGEVVHPSLRLYRESIDQVFARQMGTASMAFYSDKLHVAAFKTNAGTPEPFPIGAVFILGEGDNGVMIDQLSPSDACMALVENSFALDPRSSSGAAVRMGQAARMAAAVPCYELSYPYDFALLPDVRAQVIASLAHLADAA